MEERLLTPAQVAEHLQVTEKTVYRYLEAGELKAIKLGRLWRIREDSLREFLKKKESN